MKHRRKKALWLFLIAAGLLIGAFLYVNARIRPVLRGLADARVQAAAATAMNDAILEIMRDGASYSDVIRIYASESGVYLLQADSARLNILAAACVEAAQLRIRELGEQGIAVPLGTISGVPLLAGRGPSLRFRFTPAGAVKSSFESEFRSAGINQTLHRINLRLTATVRVILPGESHTLSMEAETSIAENIIVGEVPQAYTNVANEEDLLNLVPGDEFTLP